MCIQHNISNLQKTQVLMGYQTDTQRKEVSVIFYISFVLPNAIWSNLISFIADEKCVECLEMSVMFFCAKLDFYYFS